MIEAHERMFGRSVGRGREVILEGGKRPGEERPFVGVNNANVGERIRSMSADRQQCVADTGQLKSSEPRHHLYGWWETAGRTARSERIWRRRTGRNL